MADPRRHSKVVKSAGVEVETYLDGDSDRPASVILPSYGRDGGADYDRFTARLVEAGWRVFRPQPRGVAGSRGPMKDLTLRDLANDVAGVIRGLGAGLRLAFFAPGHEARVWLDGWYPETLRMQQAAARAVPLSDYWACGTVPLLEIIAAVDPFKPRESCPS